MHAGLKFINICVHRGILYPSLFQVFRHIKNSFVFKDFVLTHSSLNFCILHFILSVAWINCCECMYVILFCEQTDELSLSYL